MPHWHNIGFEPDNGRYQSYDSLQICIKWSVTNSSSDATPLIKVTALWTINPCKLLFNTYNNWTVHGNVHVSSSRHFLLTDHMLTGHGSLPMSLSVILRTSPVPPLQWPTCLFVAASQIKNSNCSTLKYTLQSVFFYVHVSFRLFSDIFELAKGH